MTKVRFAPSPTGYLHIGNVRTALVNWLFTKKLGGEFLLRSDDTDEERSTKDYEEAIFEDMKWLGLKWDSFARQSDRYDRYELAKQKLIAAGRLYPCYETQEELETKRKFQLSSGKPPIYDRAALKLNEEDKAKLEAEGRAPHWRFKLVPGKITWEDLVRGASSFDADHLGDPILLREDGKPTYTMSSVVDDAELGITHIIRGEDHVTNSAVQIQLFEALGAKPPQMAHLALIKTAEGGMSKRDGGFDVRGLKAKGIEAMSICSLLARLGTSAPVEPRTALAELVEHFDIKHFGRAPANYDEKELWRLNGKIVSQFAFADVQPRLAEMGLNGVDEAFWLTVRSNIQCLPEVAEWWQVCRQPLTPVIADAGFTAQAAELLPANDWNQQTWKEWTQSLAQSTGRKGKELFMPLRLALTGREHGPELGNMLPMIGRDKVVRRLKGEAA
jgi:glutamyl-tRNA synthetase